MLKFDDQFPLHRKVSGLTDAAFRLHVEAIFWSRRNLTDGFVAQEDLVTVGRFRRPEGLAAELVGRGCWHRTGEVECPECVGRHNGALARDGWVIHGFEDWQDTKAKVAAKGEVRRQAGRAGGIKSGESRRKREAKPKQVASQLLPNERTPEPPRPPSGGSGGAREALPAPPTCSGFLNDGNGWCKRCDLPKANKIHFKAKATRPPAKGAA